MSFHAVPEIISLVRRWQELQLDDPVPFVGSLAGGSEHELDLHDLKSLSLVRDSWDAAPLWRAERRNHGCLHLLRDYNCPRWLARWRSAKPYVERPFSNHNTTHNYKNTQDTGKKALLNYHILSHILFNTMPSSFLYELRKWKTSQT